MGRIPMSCMRELNVELMNVVKFPFFSIIPVLCKQLDVFIHQLV